MDYQLIPTTSDLWAKHAAHPDADTYHLPAYAEASTEGSGTQVRAAVVTEGANSFFLPLHIRAVPALRGDSAMLADAVSPYGYPGPLITRGSEGSRFLEPAIRRLMQGLADDRIVSVFVRLNPLAGLQADELSSYGRTVSHGQTVVVDLSKDIEVMWAETRKGYRYDIRKAEEHGQVASWDAAWKYFDDFIEIYRQTMARVGAADRYHFDREYFERLKKQLGEHLHLWVVRHSDQVVAGALFMEHNGIVQYHLSGTRTDYLRANPTKLLLHRAREWAKSRHNRWLHLGGGLGSDSDNLFRFKAGFSKDTLEFATWRLTPLPDQYRSLTEARHSEGYASDFFPAYRAPGAAHDSRT